MKSHILIRNGKKIRFKIGDLVRVRNCFKYGKITRIYKTKYKRDRIAFNTRVYVCRPHCEFIKECKIATGVYSDRIIRKATIDEMMIDSL
jgi:hypothetical protein